MNLSQLQQYFNRIGMDGKAPLPFTGETLSRIQSAQLASIPYENLDLLRGIPLKLDPDALFEKLEDTALRSTV